MPYLLPQTPGSRRDCRLIPLESYVAGNTTRPNFGARRTDSPAQDRHTGSAKLQHPAPIQITRFMTDETRVRSLEIGDIAQMAPRSPGQARPVRAPPRAGGQA